MKLPEFTLHSLLQNSTESLPQQTAVVDRNQNYSYQELLRQTSLVAQSLHDCGVQRGDRVGVYLDKSWESVVVILAVSQVGAVFVSINSVLKEAQIRHVIQDCGVSVLITDATKVRGMILPKLRFVIYLGEQIPEVSWSDEALSLDQVLNSTGWGATGTPATERDLATIIYTSGSTGLPKGIMISQHNLVVGAQIVSTYLANTRDDRVLSLLPFSFDYGLNQLTTMLRVGGALILQRSLMPGDILHSLQHQGITGLAGVPGVWNLLLQNRRSLEAQPLEHLRYITNSGGMIPKTYLNQLEELLSHTKIYLMYGLTEAFRSTYLPPEEIGRGPGCIGYAVPNTDVWVMNSAGNECAPGEIGELVHRGPTVAMGYWGEEARTNAVYRPNPLAPPELQKSDIVVYSGDLVRKDKDGFLHFVGRKDELIKCEGYRVSPHEVEEILSQIPNVDESAAFGEIDPLSGEKVVAVVSLKNGSFCTPDDIRQQCKQLAPHYLVPQVIHLRRGLPKTATGKIDRSGLKHEYEPRD